MPGALARSLVTAAACCAAAGAAPAQAQPAAVHFPLRLLDLSIAADTVGGVQIVARPSDKSKQGRGSSLIRLHFDPDTVLDWINHAAAAISVAVPGAPPEGIQWSRSLRPVQGRGGLALGRALHNGRLQKTRWIAIADSGSGWRGELSGTEADSLLRTLMDIGLKSRLDTTAAFDGASPLEGNGLERLAPRREGRPVPGGVSPSRRVESFESYLRPLVLSQRSAARLALIDPPNAASEKSLLR